MSDLRDMGDINDMGNMSDMSDMSDLSLPFQIAELVRKTLNITVTLRLTVVMQRRDKDCSQRNSKPCKSKFAKHQNGLRPSWLGVPN